MKRRTFMAASVAALAVNSISLGKENRYRVAVIGHTGRGDYGHGLDTVWLKLEETEIVAVADPVEKGLENELRRLKIEHGFSDYRKMLKEVKPEIVAVCPRHADQHFAMCEAAIEAGVKGIYVEKPFCRSPAEAGRLADLCAEQNVKIAVAHRNRYHPVLHAIDKMIADGQIGKLLEIRGRGKGDRRGGAEDLWVLGSHVLNLVNYFGGKPESCSAVMLQDGRRVTRDDVKDGAEGLGPMAGNELHARYRMERGFTAYFDSIANDETQNAGFGLQLIGSKGVIAIHCDRSPLAHFMKGNPFAVTDENRRWVPISSAGTDEPEPIKELDTLVHQHIRPARDLIDSIREDRQPLCGIEDANTNVQMISAVFASHIADSREIKFPLGNIQNPLATW